MQSSSSPLALVTGGSRGLGRAIAERLARAGYRLVLTGRNAETLEAACRALPGEPLGLPGDAADPEAVARTVAAAQDRCGPIDVVVNNAGISGPGRPLVDASAADAWQVLEVNLRGPLLYMHAVLPAMIARGRGTIFNIGSYGAAFPLPGNAPYAASKAALARLTDSVAAEVQHSGVQLFCLSPGLVETDMTRDVPLFQNLPPSAWSPPEAIGELIIALLERDASALNGRFLHVKDDLDALLQAAPTIDIHGLYQLGLHTLAGRIP